MQPEQLGPFRIQRVLGRGGMGAVYEGVHAETGEVAAVKVLLSTLEEDEELRLRFEAEIDTLKRLRHPNIVRLYGFGEEYGMLYYVMEMVDGPSLHQELKKRRVFEWWEAAKIGLEMCSALKHAHDRGITHRDIKPANILLEQQGTIKLSDYGIAQLFGGSHLTNANAVVGTLEFMSPEQALASPVGPRSDLYSLGAVLYAILVGRPPLSARSLGEILRKHQNNTPDPIRASRLDVPDELEAIIQDLLRPKPEDRPPNAYMAGKRFQSLLQALIGAPEKILVRPTSDDVASVTLPDFPAMPSDGSQGKAGPARGVVPEGGIIDLGGIVRDDSSSQSSPVATPDAATQVSDTPLEANADELLEQSFGRPGENVPSLREESSDSHHSCDEKEHADFLHEEYRRRGIPFPEAVAAHAEPSSTGGTVDSANLPKQAEEQTLEYAPTSKSPGSTLASPTIRHGEVVLENPTGIRRTKDEPLPEREMFEALRRGVPEPVNIPVSSSISDLGRDQATQWTAPKGQKDSAPINETSPPANEPPKRGSKASFLERSPLPIPEHFAEKTAFVKKSRPPETNHSETDDTGKSSPSAVRFVAVNEEELGGYDETPGPERRVYMSLQTVLTSIALVLIGLLTYYHLQAVPAEDLFVRIEETIRKDDSGEISPASLRQAKQDIGTFLETYSQHPKADTVRDYKEELIMANKEQELRRRWTLSKQPDAWAAAEWAYFEAVSFSRTDPEKEMMKLRAIIDLFGTDTPRTRDEQSVNRRLNETEQCVELARRRLKKLEAQLAPIQKNLRDKLQIRLDEADSLQNENPKRAEEIRHGLIELYQDRPWAAEYVERAKEQRQ